MVVNQEANSDHILKEQVPHNSYNLNNSFDPSHLVHLHTEESLPQEPSKLINSSSSKLTSSTSATVQQPAANKSNDYDLLDILSADMDFEQAYSMYTTSQQKHATSSVEQLEQVQLLNQQFVTSLGNSQQRSTGTRDATPQGLGSLPTDYSFSLQSERRTSEDPNFNYHRSQILNGNPGNKNYMFAKEDDKLKQGQFNKDKKKESVEDFDQFFSNTESNALEKFLDNLATPLNNSSLQFFSHNHDNFNNQLSEDHPGNEYNDLFDLHTMKAIPINNSKQMFNQGFNQPKSMQKSYSLPVNTFNEQSLLEHENLKKELTEAFSHPHLKSISNSGSDTPPLSSPQNQLPTPSDNKEKDFMYQHLKRTSQDLITPPSSDTNDDKLEKRKREFEDSLDESDTSMSKKRRRSSSKPLLSLEQKRLNHSHSEQKRRQMCKLAYERCLRLIIDIDAFNKLPATFTDSAQKKSKRARVNKDGLPNLSKHSALIRISHEIELIKSKNDSLKAILEQHGINDYKNFDPPVSQEID